LDIDKLFTMETRRLMRNVYMALIESVKLKNDMKKINNMEEYDL